MFKISNNLPEVFLKSPDELAHCVRQRGGGVLRDGAGFHTCRHQLLPRDGGIPGEGRARRELHGAGMQDTQVKTALLGLEERCAAHQQKD